MNAPTDATAHPLAGAKLFFYRTTRHPIALADLYSDKERTVRLDNPVVADSRGKWPLEIHYDRSQKYELVGETASGEPILFAK